MSTGSVWDFASATEKFSLAQTNFNRLLSGYSWNTSTITYSFPSEAFPGSGLNLPPGESLRYTPLSQAAIDLAQRVIDLVENAIGLDFVYDASGAGEIKIGYQNMSAGGYANYPGGSYHAVMISEKYPLETESYGLEVFIHELGHALGLKHPHDGAAILADDLDLDSSTIMSYNRMSLISGDGTVRHAFSSHMLMDILALENIYGQSSKSTNDIYAADGNLTVISDHGGSDTIDLSTTLYDDSDVNIVNLAEGYVYYDTQGGSWRSYTYDSDTKQFSATIERSAANGLYMMLITPDTTIENIVGSRVADLITGDETANTIYGGTGNDIIDGAGGTDIAIFTGKSSDYAISWSGAGACTLIGLDGTDTLTSIEVLRFDDRDIVDQASWPVLAAPLADVHVAEDMLVRIEVPSNTFVDPNGDPLAFTAALTNGLPLPAWLSVDPHSAVISGTPPKDFNGTLSIRLFASDGTTSIFDDFDLVIDPVNDQPQNVGTITDQQVTEDQPFVFALTANSFLDADNADQLTFSAKLAAGDPLPSWLVFDASTLGFSGQPGNDAVGSLRVEVFAEDTSGARASGTFNLTIINVNDSPTDIGLSNSTVTENASAGTLVGALTASDPDAGDTCLFTLLDDAKGRFEISGDQIVVAAGALLDFEKASFHSVMVRATDGSGAIFDKRIEISLSDVREDPRGTRRDDILSGDGLANVMDGRRGDDRLTGGQDADVFVLGRHYGHDVITDFRVGEGDKIDLSSADGINGLRDLMRHHVVDTGDSILVTADDGSELVVKSADLTDFSNLNLVF